MKILVVCVAVFCTIDGGICGSKDAQKKANDNQVQVMAKEENERHQHNTAIVRMQSIRARVSKMSLTDIGYYKFANKVDLTDLKLASERELNFFKMMIDMRYQLNKDYFDEAGDGRIVTFADKDDEISQPGLTAINYAEELTRVDG